MTERAMLKVALTGSIAMGKSTVAGMIRELGVPVFDADAAVHELYAAGGKAVEPVGSLFPDAIVDGAVDRTRLSGLVVGKPDAMARLEQVVHPLVHAEQDEFLRDAKEQAQSLVVFDIPLLFEGNRADEFDAVLVVSAPADKQRERALARPGMTVDKFEAILARQVPDADKCARADYVIPTGGSLDETRTAVITALDDLKQQAKAGLHT